MRIKNWKLFESTEVIKDMVEDLLRDFSDEDIPVDVEMYQPDPLGSQEMRVLILIGDEDNMDQSKDLPLYENLNSFISLNEYLIDEGYQLGSIACWIKTDNDSISGQRPITIFKFDNFINKIEEVERWNNKPSTIPHIFKLIDIYYTKK
jgi:hypothetical protein